MKHTTLAYLFVALLVACGNPQIGKDLPESNAQGSQGQYLSLSIPKNDIDWWDNTIFYEIWPRSFYDSDGDGSGDFNGMTEKLDYLQDLGITGIWLTPVFEAPSYHGYDFQNFYAVESDYGTMEEFENFIAQAHRRGIKVVLDLVLNHISRDHDWFKKSAAREPGYEDYFVWSDSPKKGWARPWVADSKPEDVWHFDETRGQYFYAVFGASQPDVNLKNQKVVDELNRLAEFWVEKGVDGFRLDAVRYALEEGGRPYQSDTDSTIRYWSGLNDFVKSKKDDVMLVGEAWTGLDIIGKYHNDGDGLDSAFDFDFGYIVIGILNPEASRAADFGTLSTSEITNTRADLWANLKGRQAAAPMSFFSPFLTNHDQNRIMHTLKGDVKKAKIAATLLFTTPGPLYMYYGEEIGMSQFDTGDDQFRRAIMQWTESENAGFNTSGEFWLDQASWFPWMQNHEGWWSDYWRSLIGSGASLEAQMQDDRSLFNHYKRLIAARQSNDALQFPDELRYYPVDNDSVWLIENRKGDDSVWTVVNLSSDTNATFTTPDAMRGLRTDRLSGKAISVQGRMTLGRAQAYIFK